MTLLEKSNGRYVIGLIIIGVGVIALLNNFGITSISLEYVSNLLWPLLLLLVGINFITRRHLPALVTGAILVGLGTLFFGRNAGLFYVDMTDFWKGFWPVILILIGVNILFKDANNTRGNLAIMGAVDKTKDAWELKSAEYTAIMGGIDLDVRKARFAEREISLSLTAIMGGITVILPDDVAATCNGTAIMGGVEIMGRGSGGIVGNISTQIGDLEKAPKVLHLNCNCIMGSIEIK